MIALQSIHAGDSLAIIVHVKDDAGAAKDLTGATVEAAAKLVTGNGSAVAATTSLGVAASGEISVSFAAGALGAGTWEIQVRATLSAVVQTVAEARITVEPSNF